MSADNDKAPATAVDWAADLYAVLKQMSVRQVGYVPDAGHKRLLTLCADDPAMRMVPLTTEMEGMGLLAGAWLGGQRGIMLMQSSGLGNCPNVIASITQAGGFPLLMFITMRGEFGEFNPWQIPMGRATPKILDLLGVTTLRCDSPQDARETALAAARLAFDAFQPVALLLSQRLIGTKVFAE